MTPETPPPLKKTRPKTKQLDDDHPMGDYRYGVVHDFVDINGQSYHPDDIDGLQVCASQVRYDGAHDGIHFVTLLHYVR